MEIRNTIRAVQPSAGGTGGRLPYGSAPLELDLGQAVDLIMKVGHLSPDFSSGRFAIVAGNTVSSSALTRKLSALQAYGLISKESPERFSLTELGRGIVFPRSPQAALEAKKNAFLNISKFNLVFQQHKGKILPADEFLKNIFEQDGKIPREYSERWVTDFKTGARIAGLLYDRGDGRIQISDSPMSPNEAIGPKPVVDVDAELEAAQQDFPSSSTLGFTSKQDLGGVPSASGHCSRINLSEGRRAEFTIPDDLTLQDAKKLKKALEGVVAIIDSMVRE